MSASVKEEIGNVNVYGGLAGKWWSSVPKQIHEKLKKLKEDTYFPPKPHQADLNISSRNLRCGGNVHHKSYQKKKKDGWEDVMDFAHKS